MFQQLIAMFHLSSDDRFIIAMSAVGTCVFIGAGFIISTTIDLIR